ncbi:SH3 domain-containing protein [Aquabacter sp. CN5-332]|uniref:SH3 domain-containing protein n=1 Tax=Aquabacter sp. CN5-332 TaxID=3156608 RepID=UPI0032B32D3C
MFASRILGLVFSLGFTCAATAALAVPGYTTGNVNMRAGPDTEFPRVTVLPAGVPVEIAGCLDNQSWCDVIYGPNRGWVYGEYLAFSYQGRRVLVPEYAPLIGIPIIGFNFGNYWGSYYRGAPWWGQRARWQYFNPRPRPGWGRPPSGPGPRPPGWWRPGYRPPPGPGPGYRPPGWHGGPPPGAPGFVGPRPGWQGGPRPGWNGGPPPNANPGRPGWQGGQRPGWQGNPPPRANPGGPRPGWQGRPPTQAHPNQPPSPRPGWQGGRSPAAPGGSPPNAGRPPQPHRMPAGFQQAAPRAGQPAPNARSHACRPTPQNPCPPR